MGLVEPVTINLDKERHLKFTLGSVKRFKQATGKDLLECTDPEKLSQDDQIAFVWACLAWGKEKDLTLDEVWDILDYKNLREVTLKLNEAIEAALPKSEGSANPPDRPDS
ncbi:hypothetical protein M0R72_12995 [Candidatus Pacearchaeota archaeon]|jgi:hypothetical protein|nr:hypothetical protein [Candidatus Pacearchaeota archaeon]